MKQEAASPKMTRAQAKIFWKNLTPQQRRDFNRMMVELEEKKLQLTHVTVDDNEQIQRIVLDHKDKPGKPDKPFYTHFQPKIITPPER
jgi:hypothetical protein